MPVRFMGGIGPDQILTILVDTIPPKMQTDAVLNQPAPFQNVWYTVVDTLTSVRVIDIAAAVQTTGEDLELEITVDGHLFDVAIVPAAANTRYFCHFVISGIFPSMVMTMGFTATSMLEHRPFFFDCGTLKVRIRKTSNNGAGNLLCGICYQKWT